MAENLFHEPTIQEQILEKRSNRRSRNRTLGITVLMAVLSMLSILVFFRVCTNNMEQNIKNSLMQSVEQRRLNVDFRLRSLLQADMNLISIVYPYMISNTDRSDQLKEYEELKFSVSDYESNAYISKIRIYVPDDKLYSRQGNMFYPLSSLLEREDEQTVSYLRKPGITWLGPEKVLLEEGFGGRLVPTNVLTCVHTMRQRSDYNSVACVQMVEVEISKFDELLTADPNEDQRGYLVTKEGICLASADQTLLQQQVVSADVTEQFQLHSSGCVETGDRVYVYEKLAVNEWYIVMDYPSSVLSITNSGQSGFLQVLVVAVMVIALTMMFVLAYNVTTNVTISRINAALDAMNKGKQQPEEPAERLNPLHQLEKNTDRMVLTVKELMESQYKDQLAIADSQMKSLQAQIKPHFLYNTLDIIKWMILDGKKDEAATMVNTLSRYLRQSINKGPVIIPLQEELELSRTYLSIMQTRFQNRFAVSFEVEDEAQNCLIPKLSLQPILENALLHGLVYCEKPEKELAVRAWVADGSLYLEVEDNGNGMSEEKSRALEGGQMGYGFANVCKRLSLFSKDQAEVHVYSRAGFGTCVAIRIPAVTEATEFVHS